MVLQKTEKINTKSELLIFFDTNGSAVLYSCCHDVKQSTVIDI